MMYTEELIDYRLLELNEDEKKCMQYLQGTNEELVLHYIESLETGRKGTLEKLASAILREDLLNIQSLSIKLIKNNTDCIGDLGLYKDWNPILIQLQKQFLREDIIYLLFHMEKQERFLVFPIEKEYAFGRFIVTDTILLLDKEQIQPVNTATDLLSILSHELTDRVKNLQYELENGTANYTLALANFNHWKQEIKEEADLFHLSTMVDYALFKKKNDASWNATLFFEQFATEGHHLHPGAKTKTGMEPEDVFHYAPEFRQTQSICFVAVHKNYLLVTESEPNNIEENFPHITVNFQRFMKRKGYNAENYRLLPVHEWQYKNAIRAIYKEEIERGVIHLLEGITMDGGASSSFRTIWPLPSGKPALKLAVNSQMTSTIRSISTQTAMNSVAFTKMMKSILEKESSLKMFIPINEIAGYSFHSNDLVKARNLSVVVRENNDKYIEENEIAIAGCSLYSISPISGKTLLSELVEEYCNKRQKGKADGSISFLKDYLAIIVPGYLTLMVKYGIALEGHLQNSVPVFQDGKLVKFFFRDWGGSRILQQRLHANGIQTSFYPDSVSVTQDEEEMRSKLFYTVFQNHIGEIIVQLCRHSGLNEELFWREVRAACDQVFSTLQAEGVEWVEIDAASLYQPMVKHKALTKMRLYPDDGYIYSFVSNPLSDTGLAHA